jgi:hypothetical protein
VNKYFKNATKHVDLGMDHLTSWGGGYGFFLKKYSDLGGGKK